MTLKLSALKKGDVCVVLSLKSCGSELYRELGDFGIKEQSQITIVDKGRFNCFAKCKSGDILFGMRKKAMDLIKVGAVNEFANDSTRDSTRDSAGGFASDVINDSTDDCRREVVSDSACEVEDEPSLSPKPAKPEVEDEGEACEVNI